MRLLLKNKIVSEERLSEMGKLDLVQVKALNLKTIPVQLPEMHDVLVQSKIFY